jgi:hypothetical protein
MHWKNGGGGGGTGAAGGAAGGKVGIAEIFSHRALVDLFSLGASDDIK